MGELTMTLNDQLSQVGQAVCKRYRKQREPKYVNDKSMNLAPPIGDSVEDTSKVFGIILMLSEIERCVPYPAPVCELEPSLTFAFGACR